MEAWTCTEDATPSGSWSQKGTKLMHDEKVNEASAANRRVFGSHVLKDDTTFRIFDPERHSYAFLQNPSASLPLTLPYMNYLPWLSLPLVMEHHNDCRAR
jgi:hypothetical protein